MNGLQILDCEQNSTDWRLARMGIATASCFDAIMTPGKTKAEQKTRRTYMLKLAGEIVTGEPMEHVMTRDMERGHLLEPEARDLYRMETRAELHKVGFVKCGRAGCSPDSLIGEDGGLEIKTKAPHLLIDVILRGEFPEEHKAQMQGAMWITGRQWWDLAVYWPGLPLFIRRMERDEAYIAILAAEVDRFNVDLDQVVTDMKARIASDPFALPETVSLAAATSPILETASEALRASAIFQAGPVDLTTVAPNGMPHFLLRHQEKAAIAEIDAPKWLADCTREYENCLDFTTFTELCGRLFLPFRAKVPQEAWLRADAIVKRTGERLIQQATGGTLSAAAE